MAQISAPPELLVHRSLREGGGGGGGGGGVHWSTMPLKHTHIIHYHTTLLLIIVSV